MKNLNRHELDNDVFKLPEVISNDFLKIDRFASANKSSTTYKSIRSIVEYHVEYSDDLDIDDDNFRVRKIVYTKPNGNTISVYAVSGVYSKIFLDSYKPSFKKFITKEDPYLIVYKLPSFSDENAESTAIVFTDIINQIIIHPRSIVDYRTCKLINGGYPVDDDGVEFIKDEAYFAYWSSIMTLNELFYQENHYSDSSIFMRAINDIFFISNMMDDSPSINNRGIVVANNISEEQIKGILLSSKLIRDVTIDAMSSYGFGTKKEDYNYKDFLKKAFINEEEVVNPDETGKMHSPIKVINERKIKEEKEQFEKFELKVIEFLSSPSFKDSLPIEKAAKLFEFSKTNPFMNGRHMYL